MIELALAALLPFDILPAKPRFVEATAFSGVRPARRAPAFVDEGDVDSLRQAAAQSDLYWARLGDAAVVTIAGRHYTVAHLRRSARELVALAERGPAALEAGVRARFDVFESVADSVLFTGYYEPEIQAAASRTARFSAPILRKPADPERFDRAAIDRGGWSGRGLELAWADPVDVYVMQLEGSGWLNVGGQRLRLAHDGSNGRPYRSVEKLLRSRGDIPAGEDVWDYLKRQPPARRDALLQHNPRYAFFKLTDEGPFGALDTLITPLRSIAVSPHMPRGLPAYMDTPGLRRLVFAQDAGKAIDTPGRVDVFFGADAARASRTKQSGRLFFLVLKLLK